MKLIVVLMVEFGRIRTLLAFAVVSKCYEGIEAKLHSDST